MQLVSGVPAVAFLGTFEDHIVLRPASGHCSMQVTASQTGSQQAA